MAAIEIAHDPTVRKWVRDKIQFSFSVKVVVLEVPPAPRRPAGCVGACCAERQRDGFKCRCCSHDDPSQRAV
jgi:hypothetical protein